jgi:hypothetical protein
MEATVPADRVRILNEISVQKGGFDAVNSLIVGAILGAFEVASRGLLAVEAAACGELEALQGLSPPDASKALEGAAAGGFWRVVEHIIGAGLLEGEASPKPFPIDV